MHDLAEAEGQIGDEVDGRDDLEHRQVGDRRQRVRIKLQRARPRPGAAYLDVLKPVFDKLADACGAIDVRNDLDQEIRRAHGEP